MTVQRMAMVLSIVLFALYTVLLITKPITLDEGVFLTIGKYLALGALPYQDFFDHKPPGIYFLFAGVFWLFGVSVWAVKAALMMSVFGSAILLRSISDALKPGIGWQASAVFLFLMIFFEGYFLIAEPFFLFPLVLTTWILITKRGRWWMLGAGISLATALLFKQTVIVSVIPLAIFALFSDKRRFGFFAVGFGLPLAATGIYLLWNSILGVAWQQAVVLTLTAYPAEPLKSVGRALLVQFAWTAPIWLLVLIGLRARMYRKKLLWALVLLPIPFFLFRHYPHYWVQILPFVAIIAAAALREFRKRTLLASAVFLLCLGFATTMVAQHAGPNWQTLQSQFTAAETLQQEQTAAVLAENKFTAFYFLLPQRPLNPYLYLTEITDAQSAQQQTIDDLSTQRPLLILWPEPSRAYAKNLQAALNGLDAEERVFPELGMRAITVR